MDTAKDRQCIALRPESWDQQEELPLDTQREAEELLFRNHPGIVTVGIPELPLFEELRSNEPYAAGADEASSETDDIVLPEHYTQHAIEPIYFIMENDLPFPEGCVVKYVLRWRKKGGVKDLKKARRYLDMMIKKTEGDPNYAK